MLNQGKVLPYGKSGHGDTNFISHVSSSPLLHFIKTVRVLNNYDQYLIALVKLYHCSRLLPKESFREPFRLPNLKLGRLSHSSGNPEINTELSHNLCTDRVKNYSGFHPRGIKLLLK